MQALLSAYHLPLYPDFPVLSLLGWVLALALFMHLVATASQMGAARLLGANAFHFLTAPGVVLHELSHALFCLLFSHQIQEMKLFQMGHDGVLGYVKHSYNSRNPWAILGNFFIGTGPIWIGSAAILAIQHFAMPWVLHGNISIASISTYASGWPFYLSLYLLFCIGAHVRLSPEDIKGSASGALLLGLLVAALVWIDLHWEQAHSLFLLGLPKIQSMFHQVASVLVLVLALQIFVALCLWGLVKLFRR